ncbi:MAG: hypothetical protein Q7R94_01285 [bacterium]|nr:hypothetical protein [bacterium]
MILLVKLQRVFRSVQRYGLFVLEILGWVAVLYFLTPILISFLVNLFPNIQIQFGDFILLITAAFILAYTYESKRMRGQIIFQDRMACAHDISFKMRSGYRLTSPNILFGRFSVIEAPNGVSKISFLSGIIMKPTGRCGIFQKLQNADDHLEADYFIEGDKDRETILRALKLKDGEIAARVLMTNGLMFLYTFRAAQGNWKKTLREDAKGLTDDFVLINKELLEL